MQSVLTLEHDSLFADILNYTSDCNKLNLPYYKVSMALEFTHLPDRDGPAVYMLHNGTVTQRRHLEKLSAEVLKILPNRQIFVVSVRDPDGEQIRNFYSLDRMAFPHILIVRDNDQLGHSWSGQYLPTAEHVAHTLRTESA